MVSNQKVLTILLVLALALQTLCLLLFIILFFKLVGRQLAWALAYWAGGSKKLLALLQENQLV